MRTVLRTEPLASGVALELAGSGYVRAIHSRRDPLLYAPHGLSFMPQRPTWRPLHRQSVPLSASSRSRLNYAKHRTATGCRWTRTVDATIRLPSARDRGPYSGSAPIVSSSGPEITIPIGTTCCEQTRVSSAGQRRKRSAGVVRLAPYSKIRSFQRHRSPRACLWSRAPSIGSREACQTPWLPAPDTASLPQKCPVSAHAKDVLGKGVHSDGNSRLVAP
jgi:hypothetical protein